MRPTISLDYDVLRANARAWRERARVPLRATVKASGYGWGFAAMVSALDADVEGYVVADADEFDVVRTLTKRPIAITGDVEAWRIGSVLDRSGLPNVSEPDALAAVAAWAERAGKRAVIRVGLGLPVGWSGIEERDIPAFGALLSQSACDVECWTHLSDPTNARPQRARFADMTAALRDLGVRVVGTDVESSIPIANGASAESSVRIGVSLFGFRFNSGVSDVRCALRVDAPVVRSVPSRGQRVGYGTTTAPQRGTLVVVRCGYSDGFPRISGTPDAFLSVGMQYTVCHRPDTVDATVLSLFDVDTDLDAIARAGESLPHEIVVNLGLASRAGA